MAASFIVEDGTIVDGANALATVEFVDQYFLDRGITAWTGDTTTVKQPAIVRATDYIVTRFGHLLDGCLVDEDQPLPFPRDEEGDLPVNLLKAVSEYSLRALTATLAPDPVTDDTGMAVVSKSEAVGPISESTTYASGGSIRTLKPYPAADMLMREFIRSSRNVIRG